MMIAVLANRSFLTAMIEKTPLARLDQRAESYVEETMARAATTFAVVRGLNGMISVIQGTEVSVSPVGVGLNLSIGEVLDPVNDLAERFSWVMLVSTTSLGLQRVLMEMGNWLGFQVLLTIAVVFFAVSTWKRRWAGLNLNVTAWRLVILAVIVRLFIPAVALVSETVYDRFLNRHYREATRTLALMSEELKQTSPIAQNEPDAAEPENTFQELRRWMAETRDLIDIRTRIDSMGAKLERFAEDMVRLLVIFVLQTIIIPLMLLWVLSNVIMRQRPSSLGRHVNSSPPKTKTF